MMKILNKLFCLIAIVSVLSISCSDDNNDLNNDIQEFKTMDLLLAEMNSKAKNAGEAITFDIAYSNNLFSVDNINIVDNFEEKFALGFAKNGDLQPGDVTVTCSDDPDNPTLCPAGDDQGSCVGSAVIKCLNKDECAEVCPVGAALVP